MQQAIRRIGVAAVIGLVGTTLTVGVPAQAHDTGIHDNCTNFNKRFPHGVGTSKAHDHTSGTAVTSFKRSNKIYWRAERHNPDLDRDNDRIACEKA
ncbi:MAG TPA: excalibur calcium-binding domain-containing protein [Nocardioidaceae bacterium]|nr:excalibur calcium-binding domain-containing protein [Nocardioidaceae bacterium]